MRIDEIEFTGRLRRINDTDFWTDADQADISMWNGYNVGTAPHDEFVRERLKEFGHYVVELTAPKQLGEILGPYVDVTTPTQSLNFGSSFEV